MRLVEPGDDAAIPGDGKQAVGIARPHIACAIAVAAHPGATGQQQIAAADATGNAGQRRRIDLHQRVDGAFRPQDQRGLARQQRRAAAGLFRRGRGKAGR